MTRTVRGSSETLYIHRPNRTRSGRDTRVKNGIDTVGGERSPPFSGNRRVFGLTVRIRDGSRSRTHETCVGSRARWTLRRAVASLVRVCGEWRVSAGSHMEGARVWKRAKKEIPRHCGGHPNTRSTPAKRARRSGTYEFSPPRPRWQHASRCLGRAACFSLFSKKKKKKKR